MDLFDPDRWESVVRGITGEETPDKAEARNRRRDRPARWTRLQIGMLLAVSVAAAMILLATLTTPS